MKPTLQEEAALAAKQIEEVTSFVARLEEPLHPPTKHLGIKMVAAAAVLGAAIYESVELLSMNRVASEHRLKTAIREALDERGR